MNWVRDRTVADVHVLVTSQDMPAGGEAFTFAFLGQRTFAGRGDTLLYNTNATTTDDEERRGLTRTLALGLVPFVARTTTRAVAAHNDARRRGERAGGADSTGEGSRGGPGCSRST